MGHNGIRLVSVSGRFAVISALTMSSLSGCGVSSASTNEATKVWGRVTYNGRPVRDAVVIFLPEKTGNTNWGVGHIAKDGSYVLDAGQTNSSLTPGRYTIFIKPQVKSHSSRDRNLYEPSTNDDKELPAPEILSNEPGTVPAQFTDPKGLSLEVILSRQPMRVDIDLKD